MTTPKRPLESPRAISRTTVLAEKTGGAKARRRERERERAAAQTRAEVAARKELGAFLERWLRDHKMDQVKLAERLTQITGRTDHKIHKSLIHRLIHGPTKVFRWFSSDELCEAAGITGQGRSDLLTLATAAGVRFTGSRIRRAHRVEMPAGVNLYPQQDLRFIDVIERAVVSESKLISIATRSRLIGTDDDADLVSIRERVRQNDFDLNELVKGNHQYAEDSTIVALLLNSGFLLAGLLEATLPWRSQRPAAAIQVYGRLVDVIEAIPIFWRPKDWKHRLARFVLRWAVLERERDNPAECERLLKLLQARNYVERGTPEGWQLWTACETQRVHTLATTLTPTQKGRQKWQDQVDEIRSELEHASDIDPDLRDDLVSVVDYTKGVGFKRFMWYLHTQERKVRVPVGGSDMRYYAEQSCLYLGQLRQRQEVGARSVRYINLYHDSFPDLLSLPELQASEIDAQVFANPEETIRLADAARPLATDTFPTVLAKLAKSVKLACWCMGQQHYPERWQSEIDKLPT